MKELSERARQWRDWSLVVLKHIQDGDDKIPMTRTEGDLISLIDYCIVVFKRQSAKDEKATALRRIAQCACALWYKTRGI